MKKLNVGCGKDYRAGWINLDNREEIKKDLNFNLEKIYQGEKLPFKENTFQEIIIYNTLEHFPYPLPILKELYRICKPKGLIRIKVPYAQSTWFNLDHKRQFFLESFDVRSFDPNFQNTGGEVNLIKKTLQAPRTKSFIKKILYLSLPIANLIIKKSPAAFEQTFLRHFFPRLNMLIVFKKIK